MFVAGHQLTGKSTVEIYRQVLLSGCRCIELDLWDGKGVDEEPIITHGFTMCTEVSCKEVLEAIAEAAFKTSDYPVLLSFENHCSTKQQAKLARYCVNIFGDMLLTDCLSSHPLEAGVPLPSPELLKKKILVKNKKRHTNDGEGSDMKAAEGVESRSLPGPAPSSTGNADNMSRQALPDAGQDMFDDLVWELETVVQDDSKMMSEEYLNKRRTVMEEKGTAGVEVEAGQDMSALVNYMEPIRFQSFEKHRNRNRSYECISFVETQATNILKSRPVDFVNYNKRQLSRVYPKGTRVDSSNYLPQIFWNAGCQMVALNFQTLDLSMQLNLGLFEFNARCGYLLKPDFMRRPDRQFDPFTVATVDGIIAGMLQVRIISGQFISDRKCSSYVEVDMFGIPADTTRRKFRTKVVPNNGVNPHYDEQPFVFKKIIMPSLACLRLAVFNETGTLLGHRILPVEALRPGYRHVGLRNELNQPQNLATLFVHIQVKDYIIDAFAEFADALSNPIAYQSELEKRAKQLSVLEDDVPVKSNLQDCSSEINYGSPAEVNSDICIAVVSSKLASPPSSNSLKSYPSNLQTHTHRTGSAHGSDKSGETRHSVGRCVSAPNTPKHSLANIPAEVSQQANNSKQQKQQAQIHDGDLFETSTVSQLKKKKQCVKLTAKLNKELELMQRKHDKAEQAKLHAQRTDVEKRMNALGLHGKMLSREKAVRLKTGLLSTSQVNPNDELYSALQKSNEELTALCCSNLRIRYDLQMYHLTLVYPLLEQIAESQFKELLVKLDKWHEREVVELKRKLDSQNWDDMKCLAVKYTDKSELARMRKEATHKHIQLAVQEREKLKDMLANRKQEAHNANQQLRQQIALDRRRTEEFLLKLYEANCATAALNSQATVFGGDRSLSLSSGGATNDTCAATYLVDVRRSTAPSLSSLNTSGSEHQLSPETCSPNVPSSAPTRFDPHSLFDLDDNVLEATRL